MTKVVKAEALDYIPDDDGYSEERFISGIPRLYSATTIRFRPVDIMKRAMLVEVRKRTNEEKFTDVLLRELTSHLVSWSLQMRSNIKDNDSALISMPIQLAYVKRLRIPLLLRMFDIVIWGADGGDPFPLESLEAGEPDDFEKRMKAMLEDPKPVAETIEADQKN
jgi:hypothetical protein